MNDLGLIFTGIAIGIAVAAPIGPVNLICIRRTLRWGAPYGFLSGVGAAIGDGVFATVAAFGLTAAVDFVHAYQHWMELIGSLFLIALAVHAFRSHPHLNAPVPEPTNGRTFGVVGVTFALTITNPATMLGFIAIFGGVAGFTPAASNVGQAAMLVAAVMAGSAIWWAGLSLLVGGLRDRMNDRMLDLINRGSGLMILGFGIFVGARAIMALTS